MIGTTIAFASFVSYSATSSTRNTKISTRFIAPGTPAYAPSFIMKSPLFILLCSGLLALVAGFTKEDHEIFRLRDEIEAAEGPEVTFYGIYGPPDCTLTTSANLLRIPDFVGVKASASQEEVIKAYRKKSRIIHPDKAKQSFIASRAKATSKPIFGQKNKKPSVHVNKAPSETEIQAAVKDAGDRYARLGVIAEILKGPGRERYDFFLNNGFPKWRGTGYYYSRFRPGLGSVLGGLFVFGGGLVHYGAMYMSWQRHREFVERIIRDARRKAWGDESGISRIPGIDGGINGTTAAATPSFAQENGASVLNRRQKRMQERESKKEDKKQSKTSRRNGIGTPFESEPETGPQGSKKRVQADNGKILIVDSVGNVFVEEEDESGERMEVLLDINEIPRPTYRQTVLFRLPIWAFHKIKTRLASTGKNMEQAELENLETTSGEEDGEKTVTKELTNGSARKRDRRGGKAH